MGNLCCCLNVNEPQDSSDGSANERSFLLKLYNHFAKAIFRQSQDLASSDQGTATAAAPTNEAIETRQSNTRQSSAADDEPWPCNAAYSQQARRINRQQQVAVNSNKLKQFGSADNNMDQLVLQGRRSNGCHSDSSMNKRNNAFLQSFDSLETEDVCPTCLEEYTPENPKITTECRHAYHLGCIYEWLERKNTCPCCSRVMKFAEQT